MSKFDEDHIKETCRWLRHHETNAEKYFWSIVRNRQVLGKKFYRQFPIRFEYEGGPGFFVADFYCYECKLVVEIDGGIHESQKDYDDLRTYIINTLNIQVARFTNSAVLNDTEKVINEMNYPEAETSGYHSNSLSWSVCNFTYCASCP